MNVLFVCSRNMWRSPTAEKIFSSDSSLSVRSAGTSPTAKHVISQKDIEWADVILCMEKRHKEMIQQNFFGELPRIKVLDIEDEYPFMDQELIEILLEKVPQALS